MSLFGGFNLQQAMGGPLQPIDTSFQTPPPMPQSMPQKSGGLFSGWGTPDAAGLTKWDRLGQLGGVLQDVGYGGTEHSQAANQALAQQSSLAMARQKQAMLSSILAQAGSGLGTAGANPVAPSVGAQPSPLPAASMAPGGPSAMPASQPPPTAPMLPAGAPAGRQQTISPQLRQSAAMMALLDGHPDQMISILDNDDKITQGGDGYLYSQKTGQVVGRLPSHSVNNGINADLGAPDAPKFFPTMEKGQEPLFDQNGRIVGVRNMDGSVAANAQQAGATAQAQEAAKAGYDLVDVPQRDGSVVKMPRAQAVRALGGGAGQGAPGGMAGSGFGVSQAPGDKAYQEATAKDSADQFKGYTVAGQQAPGKIARYRQIGQLLGNLEGGKLTPTGLQIASAANSLGFKMDPKWQNAQAADALSNQLVLDLSGGSLGTGFSNADRDFMVNQVPSIAQSAGGRKTLIDIGIRKAQREQEVASFARKWVQRAGRLDKPDPSGKFFYDYMDDYANQHPLLAK